MANQGPPAQRAYFCEHCGEYLPPEAKVCPKCGYPVGGVPAANAPQTGKILATARSASLTYLISGLDGIAGAVLRLFTLDAMVQQAILMGYPYSAEQLRAVFLGVIAFVFLASFLTLVASYLASKRKHFTLTLACGFFSIFTLGVFFLEASFLGILGIVATFRAKQEWR